ncbi:MAG: hypothetical protein IPI46_06895 [Bacteroidetes bacterium]|nr:hypothetical protein [Bacteroidota bacterium]
MKNNLFIFIFLFSICIKANAQNITQIEYFFDTDPGFGYGLQVTFPPSSNIANLPISASTASLSTGIHQFYIRSKDDSSNWSVTNRSFFYKMPNATSANSNIVAIEYFFDTDPGFGNATFVSVTPAADITNLNMNASISSLSSGVHQLYVRSQDDNGNWSITNRSFFYKIPNATSANSNIVAIEYFFDTDPGFGNATLVSVTPAADIANLNMNASIASLSSGVHQLYVRSQDDNGNWSITNRSFFYKIPNATSSNTNIVAIEYFFDTDPGFGNATLVSVTPAADIANLNMNASIASLSSGVHQLYVRSQDDNGNWSITNRSFFYKIPNATSANSNIVAIEYFFDTDPGFGNGIAVSVAPNTDIALLQIAADLSLLPIGQHNLFIRSRDNSGIWSVTNHMQVEKLQPYGIKLFLQGYYLSSGMMANVLFNQGAELNTSTRVDSVIIELHESAYPFALHSSFKCELHTDGTLTAGAPATALGQAYYIVIKHRNCFETWSANPVMMNSNTYYNFSDSSNKAFGDNMIQVEPNVWAFYSGDINQDNNADLLDMSLLDFDINAFQFGFYATDLNGDGNVDILDRSNSRKQYQQFYFCQSSLNNSMLILKICSHIINVRPAISMYVRETN